MQCPNCNAKRQQRPYDKDRIGFSTVYRCGKCHAVYGSCYKGDSYSIVRSGWHPDEAVADQLFYYDLEVLGSGGIERRHGWAHRETRLIVQVG
jgi:hypothetical protein